jgi:hypothetical protein
MNQVKCPVCGAVSVVREDPFCNEYHQHAYEVSRTTLLSVISKRLEEDPEFEDALHVLCGSRTADG